VFWLAAADIKKPTTVASRGFLSKFSSPSTNANGVANYDDYQQCILSNTNQHRREI
jgi:hypothetical protein